MICQLRQSFRAPDCRHSLKACPQPWLEWSSVWSDMVSYERSGSMPVPHDTRAKGSRFRRRRGQMTRMPLGLSNGERLFKGPLSRLRSGRICVQERLWLSAVQLQRGPSIPIQVSHHRNKSVLQHLQTGGHTPSGLPVVFINLLCFSTMARTFRGFTGTQKLKGNAPDLRIYTVSKARAQHL